MIAFAKYGFTACLSLLLLSCKTSSGNGKTTSSVTEKTETDPAFCRMLMPDGTWGVTGADGCISIAMSGGRCLFLWGDAFVGTAEEGKRGEGTAFVTGNTFTVVDAKGRVRTLHGGTEAHPRAFLPADGGEKGDVWYWPGHGFEAGGVLHLFMSSYRRTGNGVFGFEYAGCDYFRLDAETFRVIDKTPLDAPRKNGVHYGYAVLPCGKQIYVYGSLMDASGRASLHVAKAVLEDKRLSHFTYWDGTRWQSDPCKTRPAEGIRINVSEQFSVFRLKGKIVFLSQERTVEAREIYTYTADRPQGPFGGEQLIYTVNEPRSEEDRLFTYNAMAHPAWLRDGRLPVSYCVNSFDFAKVCNDACLYRPRFVWIPLNAIFREKLHK